MITRELAAELKQECINTKCEDCPFATGIYMEGPDYVYYFCELKLKPRDYDIEKVRIKQTKEEKLGIKPKKHKKRGKRGRPKKEKKEE